MSRSNALIQKALERSLLYEKVPGMYQEEGPNLITLAP